MCRTGKSVEAETVMAGGEGEPREAGLGWGEVGFGEGREGLGQSGDRGLFHGFPVGTAVQHSECRRRC
jgi:hypothetical protein